MSGKNALIVYGGWEGHTPKESAEVFAPALERQGFSITRADTLETYGDADLLNKMDVIVPIWTAGQLEKEQWQNLSNAVHQHGVGVAGFHAGVLDAFRSLPPFQFMIGGQWVAHPGNQEPQYTVEITDRSHPITQGLDDFVLRNTEQYYLHVDPGVHQLAQTTFTGDHGDTSQYPPGTVMPYAWTRAWGKGRIFVAAWGHTHHDFEVPEAKQLVERGMLWAAGAL
jgi:type 1 glutamine amidotransferase